jgi:hypothetical protein
MILPGSAVRTSPGFGSPPAEEVATLQALVKRVETLPQIQQQQTINIYADADNFKIVAGAGEGAGSASAIAAGSGGDDFFAPTPAAVVAAATPANRAVTSSSSAARGATDRSDLLHLSSLDDVDDPFADQEPAPVRSGSPRGNGGGARPAAAPSAGRPGAERSQPSAPSPRPSASRPAAAARGAVAPPPADQDLGEDRGDLSDPFAESDL